MSVESVKMADAVFAEEWAGHRAMESMYDIGKYENVVVLNTNFHISPTKHEHLDDSSEINWG